MTFQHKVFRQEHQDDPLEQYNDTSDGQTSLCMDCGKLFPKRRLAHSYYFKCKRCAAVHMSKHGPPKLCKPLQLFKPKTRKAKAKASQKLDLTEFTL